MPEPCYMTAKTLGVSVCFCQKTYRRVRPCDAYNRVVQSELRAVRASRPCLTCLQCPRVCLDKVIADSLLSGGVYVKDSSIPRHSGQRQHSGRLLVAFHRSDARRLGKEWVSTCRSRWAP